MCCARAVHGDKAIALWHVGVTVCDEADVKHNAICAKDLPQYVICDVLTDAAHKQLAVIPVAHTKGAR